MFERFFEKEATGALKGMTLEWACPRCSGKNFRILPFDERRTGEHHDHCRYCRMNYRVTFPPPAENIEGEAEFYERLSDEYFTAEEQQDLLRDYAEIEYMRADNANPREVAGKGRLLEEKIVFFKRRRRL
jgi:rubredoxin